MTIARPEEPVGGNVMVEKYVSELLAREHALVGGGPEEVTFATSVPLPVYTVNFSDLKERDFLSKTFQIGWRYLIESGGEDLVADIDVNKDGKSQFGALTRGEYVDRLAQVTSLAEKLFGASKEKFLARILEIPPLYLVAVWMHRDEKTLTEDRFLPALLGSEPVASEAEKESAFVEKVIALAKQREAGE